MLNIPDSVKALYKQDGVRKNFRAHFPGGELPDITNDNIVQESVKFTESICSQDVFKFGLTEASVIEFETVGVANMYGMMIECSSEIDCSSLSDAEIAEIEAGTWDGEFVPLADSDLGYAFFRVPYGVFRVESCPRDHQAMAHRRVTAYGDVESLTKNKFEEQKTQLFFPYSTYAPNLEHLFYANLASVIDIDLRDYGYERESSTLRFFNPTRFKVLTLRDGTTKQFYFRFEMSVLTVDYVDALDPDRIFSFDVKGNDFDAVITEAAAALDDCDIDYEASGYESANDLLSAQSVYESTNQALPAYIQDMFHFTANYISVKRTNDATEQTAAYGFIDFSQGAKAFYGGFSKESYKKGFRVFFSAPVDFRIYTLAPVSGTEVTHFYHSYERCSLYSYQKNDTVLPALNFENTLKSPLRQPSKFSSKKYTGYSFSNAYSFKDIMNSCLELLALFACSSRTSSGIIKRISNSSHVSITPGEYSQMWFDEYDVEAIGTIRYSYTDEAGEEQIVDYKFGEGASIYDMTDNAVLKAMDGASQEVIESMLDTLFIPHLAPINFTPIDLEMKGLPYIEAGDALAVTAQDGTVCNSYALRRELDGVQSLTDQIDSESGLIIDSEEGGT